MDANQLERAAYLAAHKILTTDTGASQLACPGARRSRTLDTVANIIKDVFELHPDALRSIRPRGVIETRQTPALVVAAAAPHEKILQLRAEIAAHTGS